jgi:hypothetical protein
MPTISTSSPGSLVIPKGSPLCAGDAWDETSQFGEDGLIAAALRAYLPELDPADGLCFECGAADGRALSNTKRLRDAGWSAVLVERDPVLASACSESFAGERVEVIHEAIATGGDVDRLMGDRHFHLCVLDIDAGEDAIWRDMQSRPDLMLVEFSPYAGPDNPTGQGPFGQCGINPLVAVGESKKYTLIARTYCNALFVNNHTA